MRGRQRRRRAAHQGRLGRLPKQGELLPQVRVLPEQDHPHTQCLGRFDVRPAVIDEHHVFGGCTEAFQDMPVNLRSGLTMRSRPLK